MAHQLLASDGVLAFAQPGKVLRVDRSGKPESLGQLALPLADDGAVLLPIVLLGRGELFGVVGLRLGTEKVRREGGLLQFLPEENQCRTWLTWSSS